MTNSPIHPKWRWAPLLLPVLPWLPGAAAAIFLKYKLIGPLGYGTGTNGPAALAGADPVSVWVYVSYYRGDLLLCAVAVPALLLLLARALPPSFRAWPAALLATAAVAIIYIQRQALNNVGIFLGWPPLLDAAAWGALQPAEILTYLRPAGLLRTLALVAASWALALGVARQLSGTGWRFTSPRSIRRLGLLAAALAVAVSAAAWLPRGRANWLHKPALVRAVEPLVSFDAAHDATSVEPDPLVLERRYRALTGAPHGESRTEFFGAAAGYNLIAVVLETAPSRVVDLTGDLDRFPNLAKLRGRAWVGRAHHSTHPTSEAAFFSMLSSFYGGDLLRLFGPSIAWAPGFLHGLRARGYRTSLSVPHGALHGEEGKMWRAAGLEKVNSPVLGAGKLVVWVAPWPEREQVDRAALDAVLADVRRWSSASQRFAAIYYPQSSHAPWPDIVHDGVPHSVPERGRAVFAQIDSSIGEIVDTLDELGELDRTLILVTGDHGIRTREEDPEFPAGKIDEYTFRVPFLLFAPGILDNTVEIPWLTSHIDVSPTLEALYGIETAPGMAQGSPVWDPQLAGRTTFFWSGQFHGSMGYHRAGQFAMWNGFYDEVFVNSSLGFQGIDPIPPDASGYSETVGLIEKMEAINRQWTTAVLRLDE